MIERERRFLVKYLPENLHQFQRKEIKDIYLPADAEHPRLRIRKKADKYEMTKKTLVNEGDNSTQLEQTIELSSAEYRVLASIPGKIMHKYRVIYPLEDGLSGEFDIYLGGLEGFVIFEVEFEDEEKMKAFTMPDFVLADVTSEKWAAGGIIAGKQYSDFETELNRLNYERIDISNFLKS